MSADKDLFYYAQKQAISLGGDTDTNCAIVGGMVGALVGVQHIDNHYLVTCLECDISNSDQRKRPEFV